MSSTFLVIEASQVESSLSLVIDGQIVASSSWVADRNQSSLIFTHLRSMLDELGDRKLDEILVGGGPGAYGSIRVALAAADGLALALGSKVVSFCSWTGLPVPENEYWVFSNARRGGFAFGHILNGELVGDIDVIPTSGAILKISDLIISGNHVYTIEQQEFLDQNNIDKVSTLIPSAETLAEKWLSKTARERVKYYESAPAPIYVRPPHITPAKRPIWAVNKER